MTNKARQLLWLKFLTSFRAGVLTPSTLIKSKSVVVWYNPACNYLKLCEWGEDRAITRIKMNTGGRPDLFRKREYDRLPHGSVSLEWTLMTDELTKEFADWTHVWIQRQSDKSFPPPPTP